MIDDACGVMKRRYCSHGEAEYFPITKQFVIFKNFLLRNVSFFFFYPFLVTFNIVELCKLALAVY